MKRTNWIDRKFNHDLPEGWLANIIERLAGTVPRINQMIKGLSEEQLVKKPEGKWSIKEHIGHLSDLEDLHEGRINDFKEQKEILRAADMSNKKTYDMNHNQKSITDLINEFKIKRDVFVLRLQKLDDDTQQTRSMHPRLKLMMKPVDMAYFTAEHDDHHLASVRELI